MQTATVAAIRYGFGLRPGAEPQTPETLLDSLRAPDRARDLYPTADSAAAGRILVEISDLRAAAKRGEAGAREEQDALRDEIRKAPRLVLRAHLARACDGAAPFFERLSHFWMNHFTTSAINLTVRAMGGAYVDEAIRPHLAGRFSDMLRAVVEHPAMLTYLDQNSSVGPNSVRGRRRKSGLNENLAREVLELHTLGAEGRYAQSDVRQFAELLTGLNYRAHNGVRFRPNWAEPGGETVLGRTYGHDGEARRDHIHGFLDDLARHPDTARHVARKLAVHFVHDDPPQPLVDHLKAAWMAGGGDLMAVYGALLEHPAAWGPIGGKAKPPFDFVASALVGLGFTGEQVARWGMKRVNRVAFRPMRRMGQDFMRPDGPDGWSEDAETWITPLGLSQRIAWGQNMPKALMQDALPDPRHFVDTVLADAAGPRLRWAVSASETVPQGIGLILASPEFNRR